ncbi:MAG: hypothetical protein NVS1B13_12350 [Flavisolibacter sp.]
MKLVYKDLLPQDFPENSKVWMYQSSRLFRLSEALEVELALNDFTKQWTSHGHQVKAYGNLLFGQFMVLMADQSLSGVSGCSTDSSVHFVQQLGQRFEVDFFNRTNLAFYIKDKIEILPISQLSYALDRGFINEETLYFNNLITTKKELENDWIQPVKASWLAGRLNLSHL